MFEKQEDSTISSQVYQCELVERFRDYNGRIPLGSWYSPFSLETLSVEEPRDIGSNPVPATNETKTQHDAGF